MRWSFAVAASIVTVSLVASPGAATPVDAWAFNPVFAPGGYAFLFPYAFPTVPIGTVGIDVSTTTCVFAFGGGFSCIGAGSCDANPSGGPNIGVGCLGPVPFQNQAGAPATFVECEMIPPAGFLNAAPLFYLAQDVDSNGFIDNSILGGDIVVGASFGVGAFGPFINVPVFPFGFPFLVPGIPLHVILWDPAGILDVWPDIVTVTCGAF